MYGGKVAQTLYSACSGGHTESAVNVFGGPRPLPGRRPRPLRLLLPAAQMDAQIHRPGNQLQARRLPAGQAETGRGHQDRRLPADHRRQARSAPAASRTVTGTELEVALGGYDTWMTFEKVVSGR